MLEQQKGAKLSCFGSSVMTLAPMSNQDRSHEMAFRNDTTPSTLNSGSRFLTPQLVEKTSRFHLPSKRLHNDDGSNCDVKLKSCRGHSRNRLNFRSRVSESHAPQ
jgi:hypothetical protein